MASLAATTRASGAAASTPAPTMLAARLMPARSTPVMRSSLSLAGSERDYSWRSTITGSSRLARHAGRAQASTATEMRTAGTAMNVAAS